MKLRLVIETAPVKQSEMERVYSGGQMTIGRSADADWQIDDPKMFISRRHCVISEENGKVVITDASSGGLFIDNAANPVGLGNVEVIEPGMRLHLGDFTFRIEKATGVQEPVETPPKKSSYFLPEDDPPAPVAPPERPSALPDPFGLRQDNTEQARHKEVPRSPRPLNQGDPFGLDLRKNVEEAPQNDGPKPSGGFFEDDPDEHSIAPEGQTAAASGKPDHKPDIFGDWDQSPASAGKFHGEPRDSTPAFPEGDRPQTREPERPASDPNPEPRRDQPAAARPDEDLRDALLRGMGIDPAQMPTDDPLAEMEHLGACMHEMVKGLMLLLRTRAQEKQKVRVAQTIVASENVNPLKFLATPEDALSALVRPRGRGYLAPTDAVQGAFRDLTDHQVRTWSALQIALRRMIDKFDPEEIAKEMDDVGLLESLVAGGRSAKLWQIYEDRYRDIAATAEKQFLGDVGADFRDAYENRRKE